ncbi:MAG: glycosyl hydrolase family 65 protein [Candidatus Hydrogenedentota bacterium]
MRLFSLLLLLSSTSANMAQESSPIPEDFPRFTVPGHQESMDQLRELYWQHYPGSGPKATLWDEWLTRPSLWPAVTTDNQSDKFRKSWATTLSNRQMAEDGYVATHQHASIAHQQGWPFPFWKQGGPNTWGWHFSLAGVPKGWHATEEKDQTGWALKGAEDKSIDDIAWRLKLTEAQAHVTTPPMNVEVLQAPFIQLRWTAKGLGGAKPFLEWTSDISPSFDTAQRMEFDVIETDGVHYTMIPVYKHPKWVGTITQLRINFGNQTPGAEIGIQALFTQYDTRHNINNANFVRGCINYFNWTGDVEFLRNQIGRVRKAIEYIITEFNTMEEGVVLTPWIGHGGRSGIHYDEDGKKSISHGYGVGNNYWDLLPFGHKDAYATIQFYDALKDYIALETAIELHAVWKVERRQSEWPIDELKTHLNQLKRTGNKLFWNDETGRFVSAVDIDGNSHDYGFTFLNLEAIYYDFATPEHARNIMDWIDGSRTVAGDTSQGKDIYHWQFGPRATTRRNVAYYGWFWSGPETIPWGGQVQDGGAVFGFSFHDLMARLKVNGPDDAWKRLQEILAWFDDVQDAGGYRAYYETHDGTLQGGGTAGGLGCDKEFFESVLVPQIITEGFFGLEATPDELTVNPNLPSSWNELSISHVRWKDGTFSIHVDDQIISIIPE